VFLVDAVARTVALDPGDLLAAGSRGRPAARRPGRSYRSASLPGRQLGGGSSTGAPPAGTPRRAASAVASSTSYDGAGSGWRSKQHAGVPLRRVRAVAGAEKTSLPVQAWAGRPPGGLQQLLRLLWTYYGDRQIVDRVMRRRRRRGFLELAADECGLALAATEA
jgi:hypothetical protein